MKYLVFVVLIFVIIFLYYLNTLDNFNNPIDLSIYEKHIYSQHSEDGITEKIIDLVYGNDKYNKYYVEFGVENGMECNTRILREKYNWTGLLMDGSHKNPSINLNQEFITKENIVSLFKKYSVPSNINLLCIDLDYNDFYILHEVLKAYTSDIIILEYNATFKSKEDKVIIYNKDTMWDYSNYFGASLYSFNKLCNKYNYTLVYVDSSGTNAYFIKNNIISNNNLNILNMGNVDNIYKPATYGNGPNGGHPSDPYNRQYLTFDQAINY
jgi:hypothetical protein